MAKHCIAQSAQWETEGEYWMRNRRVLQHVQRLKRGRLEALIDWGSINAGYCRIVSARGYERDGREDVPIGTARRRAGVGSGAHVSTRHCQISACSTPSRVLGGGGGDVPTGTARRSEGVWNRTPIGDQRVDICVCYSSNRFGNKPFIQKRLSDKFQILDKIYNLAYA